MEVDEALHATLIERFLRLVLLRLSNSHHAAVSLLMRLLFQIEGAQILLLLHFALCRLELVNGTDERVHADLTIALKI